MAAYPELEPDFRELLQSEAAALPGVEHVLFDQTGEGTSRVWVILEKNSGPGEVEPAFRVWLDDAGIAPDRFEVEFLTRPLPSTTQRRVRLVGVERDVLQDGRLTVKVELEWRGEHFVGEATDSQGRAIDLRTAASAAANAVKKTTGGDLDVRVVGAKSVRAFDADLIIVSVVREADVAPSLVGTVQSRGDDTEASAMALLQALNRVLGNYLHIEDA